MKKRHSKQQQTVIGDSEKQQLTCNICLSFPCYPPALYVPCGHLFCYPCIHDHIKRADQLKMIRKCPVCRTEDGFVLNKLPFLKSMLDPYITDKVPTPPQDTESPENPFRKLMLESHEILERERYVEESRKKEKEKETADELALFLQNRMPSSLSDWKDSRTFPFSCRHVKYTVLEDIPPHLMVPLYHQLRDADLKFRAIPRSGLKRLFSRKKQDIEKIYVWFEVC